MKVLFVANFSPIVADMPASKKLYVDALGLPLEGDYPMTEKLDGVKHFSLWSLSDAAQSCFGTAQWPSNVPRPQANLEFEVGFETLGLQTILAVTLEANPSSLRVLEKLGFVEVSRSTWALPKWPAPKPCITLRVSVATWRQMDSRA